MQATASPSFGAVRHQPPLPPSHPAFRTILGSIPEIIAKQGVRACAQLCRRGAERVDQDIVAAALGDEGVLSAMARDGITAFDLNELSLFLHARAVELEGAR